jgi:hypothetical protein
MGESPSFGLVGVPNTDLDDSIADADADADADDSFPILLAVLAFAGRNALARGRAFGRRVPPLLPRHQTKECDP